MYSPSMSLSHLTPVHFRKAAKLIKKKEGLLARVRNIEFELDSFAVFGSVPEKRPVSKVLKKRRKLSAAARAKIAAAQKKRWAKVKKPKEKTKQPF